MVIGRRRGHLGATLRAGNFEIISGVSPDQGGADDGPDPHQLLEAALSACTIITVQMYADRKQWPLVSVDVVAKVESEKKGADGVTETTISRAITFEGELSLEQRQRLFEIAEKCPIHRLLSGKTEIQSTLVSS